MDRLFIIQKEYIDDRHNPDGIMSWFALNELHNRNLDHIKDYSAHDAFTIDRLFQQASDMHQRIVPLGTLDFVYAFLKQQCGQKVQMKPLEIPECLYPYLNHRYVIKKGHELNSQDCDPNISFIKDIDTLKKFNSLLCVTEHQVREHIEPETNYAISENIRFHSEWRLFIYRNEILGLECYQGDPVMLPDKDQILGMVHSYSSTQHPDAYTLDVGVRTVDIDHNKSISKSFSGYITEPIEIHPFVSVGLYGFYDVKLLDMWDAGYQWYVNHGI